MNRLSPTRIVCRKLKVVWSGLSLVAVRQTSLSLAITSNG